MRHSIILGVLVLLSTSQVVALDVVEGEWELTVRHTVSGMPIANPPVHYRECFTERDPIPTSFLEAKNCDVIDQHSRGRTLYYRLSCFTEHGSIINEGQIRFGSFKISGKSKSDLGDVAGKNTVLRYKFTGRRLGECRD